MRAVLMALVLAACGKAADPPTRTTVTVERMEALQIRAVDHDADYMRRVHAHVGRDRTGAAVDPVAQAAGVTAREDLWTVDSGPHLTGHDYFLDATDRGTITGRVQLESYFAQLATDPEFAVPLGHQLAFEETEPSRWRSYYLQGPVVLDGSAVERARVDRSDDERPVVLVDLDDAGARAFGDVTGRIVGSKLAILSEGQVVVAPIINGEIRGGQLSVTVNGDTDHQLAVAESLAAKLDRGDSTR